MQLRRVAAATLAALLLVPGLVTTTAYARPPATRGGDTAAGAPRDHASRMPGATPVRPKATARTAATSDLVIPDCETTKYTDPSGNSVLRVDEGCDLDWYMYESDGPLDFDITVPRYAGPVTDDGHPATGNSFKGRQALVTLRAWDVDDDYSGLEVREIDQLLVNGQHIPAPTYGVLTGANDQWSTVSFPIETALLRFPAAPGETAVNEFQLNIDTGNPGADRWAVEIDWAELRLSDVLPVALIHGITDGGDKMNDIKAYYEQAMWQLGGQIIAPEMTKNRSTQENARLMHEPILQLMERTGADQVNLVAHSMGGLDSRRYAWWHPGTVRNVVMIATPNAGSEVADHLCDVKNRPEYYDEDYKAWITLFSQAFGDCVDAEDGLYQLQTSYVRDVFNLQVRDNTTGTSYATIAGDGFLFPTSYYMHGRNDGVVSVDSVRWMASDRAHGGVHETLNPIFALNHNDLIHEGSGAIPLSLCHVYPANAACTVMAPAATPLSATLVAPAPVQLADVGSATLAPGGDAQLQLTLDDGVPGEILLFTQPGVTGAYNGAAMQATTVLGVPALTASTTGGTAVVSLHNTGSAAAVALAMGSVHTSRALAVTGPGGLPAAGTPVTATVSLSGATAGDQVKYRVLNSAGDQLTAGTASAAGPGSWTATFTPATAGSHTVVAWTEGAGSRTASVIVPIGANDGRGFGSGATWAAPDANGDGRRDALEVSVPITAPAGGTFEVSADLVGPDGQVVASTGSTATVEATGGSVTLRFDGRGLFRSGQNGPYTLSNLVLSDSAQNLLARVANQATSEAYAADQFDHFDVEVDQRGFTDEVVDADHDRYAETLRVNGGVRVDTGGYYAVNARLVGPDGQEIAEFQQTATFTQGQNALTLAFPWSAMTAAGVDGPYTVTDLSVYPIYDAGNGAFLTNAHTTPKYLASGLINREPTVEAQPITLEGNTTGGYRGTLSGVAASDPDGDQVILTDDAADPLPVGSNSVVWTATDGYGASSTTVQSVTIRDTTAPTITCPAAVTSNSTTPTLGSPTAADIVDSAPGITNDAPAVFPSGVTIVRWQARDDSGNLATCTQSVTVSTAYAFTGFFVGNTNVGNTTTCQVLIDAYSCSLTIGFQLRDAAGNVVSDAAAISGWSWDTKGSASAPTYDAATGRFTMKITVTPAQPGTYPKFTVRFADGSSKTLKVSMI